MSREVVGNGRQVREGRGRQVSHGNRWASGEPPPGGEHWRRSTCAGSGRCRGSIQHRCEARRRAVRGVRG